MHLKESTVVNSDATLVTVARWLGVSDPQGPLAEARTEAGRHVVDITYKYFSCYKLNDDSVIYLTEDA
jgi:hypothetical protein